MRFVNLVGSRVGVVTLYQDDGTMCRDGGTALSERVH